MARKILVGTASWTDPGFIADWYPRDLAAADRLSYYAERFNLVEVNSTFYAVPASAVVRRWCEQTPGRFIFDVKLHRLLSRHSTDLKSLPPDLRAKALVKENKVQPTPALEKALVKRFLDELGPLADSGKLGALLLQLTPSFCPQRHSLDELDNVVQLLDKYRLAVELRNRHWVLGEQLAKTEAYFKARKVAFVGVDAPQSNHFMAMPSVDLVTDPTLSYLRLHGRNESGYITGKTVAERFDYLYSSKELKEIAQRTAKLAEQTAETHVIYNNNAHDYPLRNAATFQKLLSTEYPETAVFRPKPRGGSDRPSRTQPETLELGLELDPAPKPKSRTK